MTLKGYVTNDKTLTGKIASDQHLQGLLNAEKNLMGEASKLDVLIIDTYNIAVKNGYKGTVEDWLAQLNYAKTIYSCELTDNYILEVSDMPELIAGHVYTVNYNGADYVCMCRKGDGGTYLGNVVGVITEYTEPFCIWYFKDGSSVVSLEELTGIRVNISEGYPYYFNYVYRGEGKHIASGVLEFDKGYMDAPIDLATLRVGKTYQVKWGETIYCCELKCERVTVSNETSDNYTLGNEDMENGGTGEPFLFSCSVLSGISLFKRVAKYGTEPENIPYAIYEMDGYDGYTPIKGTDYYTEEEKQELIDDVVNELRSTVKAAKIGEVTLLSSAWEGGGNLYYQAVRIDGVTENSQVDITPSVEQLVVFYEKDITFVTENEDGNVTVYAIGQKPTNDYTIQVTITEVEL